MGYLTVVVGQIPIAVAKYGIANPETWGVLGLSALWSLFAAMTLFVLPSLAAACWIAWSEDRRINPLVAALVCFVMGWLAYVAYGAQKLSVENIFVPGFLWLVPLSLSVYAYVNRRRRMASPPFPPPDAQDLAS